MKKNRLWLFLAAVMLLLCMGCDGSSKQAQPYLLTVGELTVTKQDFKRFWESYTAPLYANADVDDLIFKAGIDEIEIEALSDPFLIIKLLKAKVDLRAFINKAGMKQLKMEAFDQFLVAMLIEARAHDLGIAITNEELEIEIAKVRDEYTKQVFDETLRKAAMPFDVWREDLRRRLLMETVMRADLYAHGEITPEDVERFGGLNGGKSRASAEEVLERVYRGKAESDFQNWIRELQNWYPVIINEEEMNAVLSE